jgi:hypothetical protein
MILIQQARQPGKTKPDGNRIRHKPFGILTYRVDRFLSVHTTGVTQ